MWWPFTFPWSQSDKVEWWMPASRATSTCLILYFDNASSIWVLISFSPCSFIQYYDWLIIYIFLCTTYKDSQKHVPINILVTRFAPKMWLLSILRRPQGFFLLVIKKGRMIKRSKAKMKGLKEKIRYGRHILKLFKSSIKSK